MADILGTLLGPISGMVRVVQGAMERMDRLGQAASAAAEQAAGLRDKVQEAALAAGDLIRAERAASDPAAYKSLEDAAEKAARKAEQLADKLQQAGLSADQMTKLQAAADKASERSEALASALAKATAASQTNNPEINKLEKAAKRAAERADALQQALAKNPALLTQLGDAAERAQKKADRLAESLEQARTAATSQQKQLGQQRAGAQSAASQASSVAGAAEGMAGEAAGGAAMAGVGAALGAMASIAATAQSVIEQAIAKMSQWVEALNPGLMQQFNRSIRDLQATFGHAFAPIFDRAIDFFEDLAGMVFPIMEKLRPIVDELASEGFANLETTLGLLADVIDITIEMFKPLIDAYRVFEARIAGVVEVLDGLWKVVRTAFDTLNALVGKEDIADTVKQVRQQFHELTKSMVVFVAQVARAAASLGFLAGNAFVDNLIKAFEPKVGEKAAGPVSTQSLESIAKQMAEASYQAAGGGGEKEATNKDIVDALKEVKSGQDTGSVNIVQTVKDILKWLQDHEPGKVYEQAKEEAKERAKSAASRGIDPFGFGYGDKIFKS